MEWEQKKTKLLELDKYSLVEEIKNLYSILEYRDVEIRCLSTDLEVLKSDKRDYYAMYQNARQQLNKIREQRRN